MVFQKTIQISTVAIVTCQIYRNFNLKRNSFSERIKKKSIHNPKCMVACLNGSLIFVNTVPMTPQSWIWNFLAFFSSFSTALLPLLRTLCVVRSAASLTHDDAIWALNNNLIALNACSGQNEYYVSIWSILVFIHFGLRQRNNCLCSK